LFTALLGSALAQDPADLFSKAPPAIDQALRTRVQKFYEEQRDGKFRAADVYVAEDSKDTYFEADKRRCKTFEVGKITYTENFQKADVLILCDTTMLMPPRGVVEVKMPLNSKWKVVGNDWFWFVEPKVGRDSPFGKMFPGSGSEGGVPSVPRGPDVKDLARMVKVDRNVLKFRGASAGADEVKIISDLQGEAQLVVEAAKTPDLEITLDKSSLEPKGTATLSVRYSPAPGKPRPVPSTYEFRVQVMPLGRVIPLQVAFN
jgi:hypothetical protein